MRARSLTLPMAGVLAGAVFAPMALAGYGQSSPVFDVSAFPAPADDPQLQAAPDGAVTFVWEGWNGSHWQIMSRTRGPRGGWRPISALAPSGADHEDPRIAIGGDGTTSVIWKNMRYGNRRVQLRTRPPGGRFGAITTLSGSRADATEDRIAIGPQGQTAVAWAFGQGGRRALQFRERRPSHAFESVRTLSPYGGGEVDPEIAYAPDGTVTVVWELATARESIAYARIRRPGEAFGPIIPLSLPAGRATDVMAATNPQTGVVTVVWERVGGGGVRVQSRTVAPDGTLGDIQDLSQVARHASDSDIAVAPDGTTTVVWEIDFTGRDLKMTQTRTRPAGATEWGPTQTLTARPSRRATDATGPDVDDPVLAVTPDGVFRATWKQQDGRRNVRVQARTRATDGTWSAPVWLSAPNREADEPRITASPQGVFTVVWKIPTGVAVYPEQDFGLQATAGGASR